MNRRHGNGITVYNPPDKSFGRDVVKNTAAQELLNKVFDSSEAVRMEYSYYGFSNSGVFVLMDLKGNNKERFLDLHNVISEGRCKVNKTEERRNGRGVDAIFRGV